MPGQPLAALVAPDAGSGRRRASGAAVLPALAELGHDVVDVTARSAAATVAAARRQVAAGVAALVVVGGDGTVQLGASAVAGTGVPLVVLPAGSGNDTARALGIVAPRGGVRGARAAARRIHDALTPGAPRRCVDLLAVRGAGEDAEEPRWVVSVVAAGFDAAVNARANTWARSWPRGAPGRARYTAAVLRELPAWRPRPYRLVLDGVASDHEAVLVAVAGTTTYGGGLRIAPHAVPDDGLADVVVVGALTRAALLAMLPTVFAGLHTRHPAVTVHRAASVGVELLDVRRDAALDAEPAPVVAHGDGEALRPLPLVCQVVPGALELLA